MKPVIETIRTDLYGRYSHVVPTQEIDKLLEDTYQRHMDKATIVDFVPVLVAREVTEEIETSVWEGRFARARQRIVFAARNNRRLADAAVELTRALSGDSVLATSAWAHPENATDVKLEWIFDELGLQLPAKPVTASSKRVLDAADVVVYLSDNEVQDLAGHREVVWDLPDTNGMELNEVRELADDLSARVHTLLNSLGIEVETRTALAA